ncbi:MAG: L-seryl-tRNA(Sec) selenium transferase [Coriobacteriales bacterium]|jgi:L-seryl-tRNA(Ser) seleniumtransferase
MGQNTPANHDAVAPAAVAARLRALPRVDDLLEDPRIASCAQGVPRAIAREAVRGALDRERAAIRAGGADDGGLVGRVARAVGVAARPMLRGAVNATGVVIHTNLGRAPIAPHVARHVADVATHYSTLEFDVDTCERGSRHNLVSGLLSSLTGAQDAAVVNNNAAAVLLVLSEFARGREVIVSRGELIEIGGSFRIPDIMEMSGARMVEVGTTNKTHLSDYERAITSETAMILKVHPSNYRVVGFHEEVPAQDLARLAHDRGLLVYEDQGSGMLVDIAQAGVPCDEHTAGWSIAQGIDIVSCSGDKLLGASQAGIVLGASELVGRVKKNPLMRAMRPDKLTLAALEATLRDYLDPGVAWRSVPVLRMLGLEEGELRSRAERVLALLRDELRARGVDGERLERDTGAARSTSYVGGGALPTSELPTWVVRVRAPGMGANELRAWLIRTPERPVVTRVERDWVVCDVRTLVDERDESDLVAALAQALALPVPPDANGSGGAPTTDERKA